jgi:hypothetical protein
MPRRQMILNGIDRIGSMEQKVIPPLRKPGFPELFLKLLSISSVRYSVITFNGTLLEKPVSDSISCRLIKAS